VTVLGFDYTNRIAPAALKQAGCKVVFRYLSKPGWPKNLTAPEARELLAAGIPIVLNFETTASFMLGGYAAGVACAKSARAQATTLGAPKNTRIWYSADLDVAADQIPLILEFCRGAAFVDGHNEVGVYGGLRVAKAVEDADYPAWQTVAWSGGRWDPRDVARQTGEQRNIGGRLVDVNDILDLPALGAWGGPFIANATTFGDNMGTIPATIGQKWPEIAAEFPANAPFDDEGAIIWADGGARAAALYAKQARDAVNALAAKIQQPPAVDVKALATALAPLLAQTPAPTADQIATAVLHHLSNATANG
jgi:hypothetical protein